MDMNSGRGEGGTTKCIIMKIPGKIAQASNPHEIKLQKFRNTWTFAREKLTRMQKKQEGSSSYQ